MCKIFKHFIAIFLFTAILSASNVQARSLSPDEALDRALTASPQDELSVLSVKAGKSLYKLTKATPEYYVFNREGGGYIIVSADDRLYEILADVDNGSFSPDSIPGLKWITDGYTSEIRAFLAESDNSRKTANHSPLIHEASNLPSLYSKWDDIPPIMTTCWGQSSPYNNHCPFKNGVRSVTGCTATAMAQVVKAIGHYRGTGYKTLGSDERGNPIEFDYESAEFDLLGMKDVYDVSSTEKEKAEIADLMLACGVGTNMKYGNEASAAFTRYVSTALVDHFGFDPDYTCFMERGHYNAADWERVIYTELSLGRPVHYSGGGHAYVIDGYRRHGMYHVNWGWDGSQQGYFRLSALITPLTLNDFTAGQQMSKSVPLGADPGYVPSFLNGLTGGIELNPDGTLSIRYTSLGSNPDTSLGIIILDENNSAVERITFWTGYNLISSSVVRDPKKHYDFSSLNLPEGSYKVYPAYKSGNDTELQATGPCNKLPSYILLSVNADGECICSNIDMSVYLAEIGFPDECLSGYSADLVITMVNGLEADYSGTLTISLTSCDNDNDSEYICSATTDISIYAGDNSSASCSLMLRDRENNPLTPGDYTVTVADNSGTRFDNGEFIMTVTEGTPKEDWSHSGSLRIENADEIPEILPQGALWPHTPRVVCTQSKKVNISVTFYLPGKNTIVKDFSIFSSTINTGSMYYLHPIDDFTVDVPFGTYDVAYTNNLSRISARKRVRISREYSNGQCFAPKGENEAALTARHSDYYSGDISISEKVEFDGVEYPVTAIEAGAFSDCAELRSVSIPASVNHIGTNAFAYCRALEYLQLHNTDPAFRYINLIAPGLPDSCCIYVTAQAWDSYNKTCRRNNLYCMIESVESLNLTTDCPNQATLTFTPSHPAINKDFRISAIDDSIDPIAEISVSDVQAGIITLEITPLTPGTQTFRIESAQPGIEPALITLTVSKTDVIGITAPDDGRPDRNGIMYNLKGEPVDGKSNCPAGVYIIKKGDKSEKIIISAGR